MEAPGKTRLLPHGLFIGACAAIALSSTQVTVRHLALRLTGVRCGRLESVTSLDGKTARCADTLAVFRAGELRGDRLWCDERSFEITDNGQTWIDVRASADAVRAAAGTKGRYLTGFTRRSARVRAALACPALHFTLADVAVGGCFAGLLGVLIVRRRLRDVAAIPVAAVALVAVGGLSLLPAARLFDVSMNPQTQPGTGLKELLQYVEVFGVAYLVFRHALDTPRRRAVAAAIILGIGACVVVLGLVEYAATLSGRTLRGLHDIGELDSLLGFRYNPARSNTAGSESSRHMLGTYLLLLLPFAAGIVSGPGRRRQRWVVGIGASLGLLCIQHLGLLLCTAVGCVAVAFLSGRRLAPPATVLGLVTVLVLACVLIPHHGTILLDSVALRRYNDPYGLLPMPVKGRSADSVPGWQAWQQKYVEMQAALNGVSLSPVLGHGIGHYQLRINGFYTQGRLPGMWVQKGPVNFMEQDAHGLYFVQAVETGVVGLTALVLLLLTYLQTALRTQAQASDAWDRAAARGVCGTLLAVLLAGFICSPLVRGLQFILVALAALPAAAAAPAESA